MNETNTLIELIDTEEKLVAMLAPSFPIVFAYPTIITMLRVLGFSYVVEVATGAKKTNAQILELLKSNPDIRFITSPCPTVVRMVKSQMPQYAKYFPTQVDSPMCATAKICREHFPGYKPVFIGPCVMKKKEAQEDIPELGILVFTYQELSGVFDHYGIPEQTNPQDHFDISEPGLTQMYAMDGGLAHSSGLYEQLPDGAVKIVSGAQNNISAIKEFDTNPQMRVLDILNCPGGCIGGPGIKSPLTTEERRKKILAYYTTRAKTT